MENSWIEINGVEDLPKTGEEVTVYWIIRKGFLYPMFKVEDFFDADVQRRWLNTYSHFQRIARPPHP